MDGGEWNFFYPSDGLFDETEEPFAVDITSLAPGPHVLAVKAVDAEGNVGVGNISINIPVGRASGR